MNKRIKLRFCPLWSLNLEFNWKSKRQHHIPPYHPLNIELALDGSTWSTIVSLLPLYSNSRLIDSIVLLPHVSLGRYLLLITISSCECLFDGIFWTDYFYSLVITHFYYSAFKQSLNLLLFHFKVFVLLFFTNEFTKFVSIFLWLFL